jgi:hypothetical protein
VPSSAAPGLRHNTELAQEIRSAGIPGSLPVVFWDQINVMEDETRVVVHIFSFLHTLALETIFIYICLKKEFLLIKEKARL